MTRLTGRPSLFSHVLERLGTEIVRGAFDVTGALPREPELCERLSASRSVIREVLRVLSQKGMIVAQPKVGVRLRPSSHWNLMDVDVLDWIWRSGRNDEYVKDFLEFRLTFEPMACHQAAVQATLQAKNELLACYNRLLAAVEGYEAGRGDREFAIDCDLAFHRSIYLASGNRLSGYLAELVAHLLRLQVDATTALPGEFSRGMWLHRGVAESISAGDPQAAYRYSHELVKMPYETYMNRKFPRQPMLELPAPGPGPRAIVGPARVGGRQ